ncbi:arylsulfatase [Vibrio astriarenae]|nr:arylsulfatase [Vibrio sp. C7]
MHVDHVSDLISLIKSSYFGERSQDMPIFGPTGNHLAPGMTDYMERLVGVNGLYPYLNNYITDAPDSSYSKANYRFKPHDIEPTQGIHTFKFGEFRFKTADAQHGNVPALAWSIEYKGKEVLITGDSSGPDYLKEMANAADLIVAHNSLPQAYSGPVERLHMKPEKIGKIVSDTKAHTLYLVTFSKERRHTKSKASRKPNSKKALTARYPLRAISTVTLSKTYCL